MSDCNRWTLARQIDWFRRQFARQDGLPFAEVLPPHTIRDALRQLGLRTYDSLYNPITVLWLFLGQVMHANPTLAVAVEGFLAWRRGQGLPGCSADTGAYARARQRLPEALLALLTRQTGRQADQASPGAWRWLGRMVKIFDGSTVSMPDTPANQRAYPQSPSQKPGVGFPLARIGVLFSLSVGTVLELSLRRFAGKFQSELAMLREMMPALNSGDILLSDRYLCSFTEIALLVQRGVDFVGRMNASRQVDFRRGQRLGKCDHVVGWSKPPRPEWMPAGEYAQLPGTLLIREFRYQVIRKGYRPQVITVATTLLEEELFPRQEIAALYRMRWDAEINLRSLKIVMQMDVLRCQTPEMVRKEIWAHLLAYNLIRTVIMQAAWEHGKNPRQLSFKRALRTLEAFRPVLSAARRDQLPSVYHALLQAIASHDIGHRPDRLEPRERKRRPKPYKLMTKPRPQARRLEAKTR